MVRYTKHDLSRKRPKIPFTKAGYQEIVAEQEKLQAIRPEAVENLRKAREMGDLSENGYYKAARARLSEIDARLRRVQRLVRFGVIVESSTTSSSVQIGSKVSVSDGSTTRQFTIVGGYESNPLKKTISFKSPIGRALIHRHVGEKVEVQVPAGTKRYTITAIEPAVMLD